MKRLSKKQIIFLQQAIIEETGGTCGIRDDGLLESAINGVELEYLQEELSDMVLRVAAGSYQYEDILKWIIQHQI